MPRCILLLVAPLAIGNHLQYIRAAQPDDLRSEAEKMNAHVAKLGGEVLIVALQATQAAVRGAMHAAHRRSHLVAACASLAVLRSVIVRSAEDARARYES
jgi:hypothetical protein